MVKRKPETESRLQEPAASTGRAPDELVEEAISGYLAELSQLRNTLDRRYDQIKSGKGSANRWRLPGCEIKSQSLAFMHGFVLHPDTLAGPK